MARERLAINKGLPNRWRYTRNAFYYQVPKDEQQYIGKQTARLGNTMEEARQEFERIQGIVKGGIKLARKHERRRDVCQIWERAGYEPGCGIPYGFLDSLLSRSRHGAIKRNMDFALSERDLVKMAKRANGACEISGMAWSYRPVGVSNKRPWAPSVDRIDSRQGYYFDNCRLVCFAANVAMLDWGDDVLFALLKAVHERGSCDDL